MDHLERYNNEMQKLLGNSDKLEPMRRKRRCNLPRIFEQFRLQASSFHAAIAKALPCDCTSLHSTKLLLRRDENSLSLQSAANTASESVKLSVYFPLASRAWSSSRTLIGPDDSWYAAEVEMVTGDKDEKDTHWPIPDDESSVFSVGSKLLDRRLRKVSFQGSDGRKSSSGSVVPKDSVEILDLCAALKQYDESQANLGFLRDNDNQCHTIHTALAGVIPTSQIRKFITLETMLTQDEPSNVKVPRQRRLAIALVMARSLLQLHTGPWLNDAWGKNDIYFFQNSVGEVETDHPLLVCNFRSSKSSQATISASPSVSQTHSRSSLLSLGILILELWFNQTIESRPFRQQFLGPDGRENEYTNFNTAQKWQEQALEEGGLDLHNLTRRCIYCAFGAASQDLNNEELQRAIYDEVVQALERLLARYEEV